MIPTHPWPDVNVKMLVVLDWIASGLSLISSLVLFYLCLRVPSPKTTSVKFILALAVADFFYSLSNILSNFLINGSSDNTLCFIQGAMRHSSFILSVFFSAGVARVSYLSALPKEHSRLSTYFIITVCCGLVMFVVIPTIRYSLLFILLISKYSPLIFRNTVHYYYHLLDCSLKLTYPSSKFHAAGFYLLISGFPICVSLILIIQGYILTIKKTKALPESLLDRLGFNPSSLLIYPVVINVTLLPSVIDNIGAAFSFPPSVWMIVLEIGISHSIGLINAVMYVKLRGLYYSHKESNYKAMSDAGRSRGSKTSSSVKNRETYVPSYYSVEEVI